MKRKCINLQGDAFEPSGAISGGYTEKDSGVFHKIKDINLREKKAAEIKNAMEDAMRKCEQLEKDRQYYDNLKQQLALKE